MPTAEGTFEISLRPVNGGEPAALGRFEFDKTFSGGLSGTSRGAMLSAGDPASGSAGYVVVEVLDVEVAGLCGGFALQHLGVMRGGAPELTILVVPGSGTGDLVGISGTFVLDVDDDGTHRYRLDYEV